MAAIIDFIDEDFRSGDLANAVCRLSLKSRIDAAELETVMRYHERTKHHFNSFAPGPSQLDWVNYPDPFGRYAQAPLIKGWRQLG